jgi:hypothetical protein
VEMMRLSFVLMWKTSGVPLECYPGFRLSTQDRYANPRSEGIYITQNLTTSQVCCGTKRIYVHDSIYQEFLDKMVATTKTFECSTDKDAFMGPISNKMQYDRVNATLDEIEHQGFNIALGDRHSVSKRGYLIPPTIVGNPSDDSNIVRKGCFGTVTILLLPETTNQVYVRSHSSCPVMVHGI